VSTTPHSSAIILSSGDEIITGQLLDTNTQWLAERLVALGIMPREHISIPDDLTALVSTLRRACDSAPLVIITGGLGPTDGDLTRQALAQLLSEPLITDEASAAAIRSMLEKRARPITDRQLRQAQRPTTATSLPNQVGTAPGLHAQVPPTRHSALGTQHSAHSEIFALPGPPGELRPMFEREVLPRLRPPADRILVARLLYVIGLAEADCVDRLGDLTRRDRNPLIGITASGGILTIRIRYEGPGPREAALDAVDRAEGRIRDALGAHLLAIRDADSGLSALARCTIDSLAARKPARTLAVVESCTGGMLGEMITAIPGSSSVFRGGFITYANALKEELGVDPAALQKHGAVSTEVATQMALRGLARAQADHCLAITGIAGPDGGTPEKPVGTVHIALATAHTNPARPTVIAKRFLFTGDRHDIRQRAATSALTMLHFHHHAPPATQPRLLWETTNLHPHK
jgi:nicotinamide-nucleotide amidase